MASHDAHPSAASAPTALPSALATRALKARTPLAAALVVSLASLAALAPSAGCTRKAQPSPFASGEGGREPARPKLLLVIVLDQFREEYLTRFAPYLGDSGFRALAQRGASFTGHYGHYVTYTGPGHALLLSGSYPYVNGIGANGTYVAERGRVEATAYDHQARLLGRESSKPGDDLSPRSFSGTTVGDELALATGQRSRTVAIATKGRGAILLGGRLGKAYWMDDDSGQMTTSSYYAKELPAWATAWNARREADGYFGKRWEKALPDEAYAGALPEPPPHKGEERHGLPRVLGEGMPRPGKGFYEQVAASPFGNDLELSFARAALDGEKLGQRGVTDVLAVSLSATDLVGHDHGPHSPEVQDLVVRADRQIGAFLSELRARFGDDGLLTVVTADHGATPVPEQMAQLGFDAGRIKKKALSEAIEARLSARFGGEKWVVALEDPHVFLDRAQIARRGLDPAEVERTAGEAAAGVKGIGGFLTRAQLLRGEAPGTELGKALVRSYHGPTGGDVVLWTLPFYFWGKYGERDGGTTHGTSYRYDADVPLLVSGPGVRPGRYGVTEMVDLAPTLSRLVGVSAPAASEGKLLPCIEGGA